MKLADWEIEREITDHKIVTPYAPSNLQPNSLDIRLGNTICEQEPVSTPLDTKHIDYKGWTSTAFFTYELQPNQFILADTLEYFNVPDDIYLELHGKSSLARIGLTIHQTGGLIDSGFRGTITLEIKNESNRPIILHRWMPIGQVTFEKISPVRIPYNRKSNAKYNEQSQPTFSKYEI